MPNPFTVPDPSSGRDAVSVLVQEIGLVVSYQRYQLNNAIGPSNVDRLKELLDLAEADLRKWHPDWQPAVKEAP